MDPSAWAELGLAKPLPDLYAVIGDSLWQYVPIDAHGDYGVPTLVSGGWTGKTLTAAACAAGPCFFARSTSTGDLHRWTGTSYNVGGIPAGAPTSSDRSYATTGWGLTVTPDIQGTDIAADNTPDLWATNTTGNLLIYRDNGSDGFAAPTVTGTLGTNNSTVVPAQLSWNFNEGVGQTAYDITGNNHSGTLCTGANFSTTGIDGGAVTFNGTSGCVTASGPVIDTMQSFTVAAWVNASALGSSFRTAISIDGVHTSAFYLQYRADSAKWCATLAPEDSNTRDTSHSIFCSSTTPTTNTWIHLAFVYNAASRTATLYVNGASAASGSYTSTWAATGKLAVGRGFTNSAATDWWQGQIDDPHIYQAALDPTAIQALYNS